MNSIKLTLTANAGMLIDLGEVKLLIDAFHSEKYESFGTVSETLFHQILSLQKFADPDVLIYTHCHPDHFCAAMTRKAREVWPDMQVILPESKADGILLNGSDETLHLGKMDLSFHRLPHENVRYESVPHYGVLIHYGSLTILDPGDCEIASDELASFVNKEKIDLAILNFPWIALRKGRDFVKNIIRPAHIAVCHLPEPESDVFHYRKALDHAIERDFWDEDIRVLDTPLSCTEFVI